MDKMIPYGRQCIEEDDIQAVIDVLKSDYLTTGPMISTFERAFAERLNAKHAVAVSNGTAALHAAAFALDLKEGDEVITTPMTFAATSNAVLYMNAKPVFVDIDPETYNIDPSKIEAAITARTKAVFVVHFTGQPCPMDEVHRIAIKYGLRVVEDASHELGAEYDGRPIGALSDLTTFSFHPVKHITTGEGGMVTTDDDMLNQRLLLFRTHGITRSPELLINNEGPWYYEQQELGFNYRLTDIQCALGMSQLKKLDAFVARRKAIAARYSVHFQYHPYIRLQRQMDIASSSWHLYVLRVDFKGLKKNKVELFEDMRQKGILLNLHYIPVYRHPYYRKSGYGNTCCKEADSLYDEMFSIPIYPMMTDEDVDFVAQELKNWINHVSDR